MPYSNFTKIKIKTTETNNDNNMDVDYSIKLQHFLGKYIFKVITV